MGMVARAQGGAAEAWKRGEEMGAEDSVGA
jgi:hypothetical protein